MSGFDVRHERSVLALPEEQNQTTRVAVKPAVTTNSKVSLFGPFLQRILETVVWSLLEHLTFSAASPASCYWQMLDSSLKIKTNGIS